MSGERGREGGADWNSILGHANQTIAISSHLVIFRLSRSFQYIFRLIRNNWNLNKLQPLFVHIWGFFLYLTNFFYPNSSVWNMLKQASRVVYFRHREQTSDMLCPSCLRCSEPPQLWLMMIIVQYYQFWEWEFSFCMWTWFMRNNWQGVGSLLSFASTLSFPQPSTLFTKNRDSTLAILRCSVMITILIKAYWSHCCYFDDMYLISEGLIPILNLIRWSNVDSSILIPCSENRQGRSSLFWKLFTMTQKAGNCGQKVLLSVKIQMVVKKVAYISWWLF